jgi:O-antigen/teichoic acid export membrane protein
MSKNYIKTWSGSYPYQMVLLFFGRLLNLLNSVNIVKFLEPEKLGVSTILQAANNQASCVTDFGLNDLASREKNNPSVNEIYLSIVYFRLFASLLLASVSIPIYMLYFTETVPSYLFAFLILSIVKTSLDTVFYYRNSLQMGLYYLINILPPASVMVFYFIYLESFSIAGIDFIVVATSAFTGNIILLAMMLRNTGRVKFDFIYIINLISKNWKLSLASAIAMTSASIPIFISAYVLDLIEMGYLRATLILLIPFDILISGTFGYLYPKVVDWNKADTFKLETYNYVTYVGSISVVAILVISILANTIITKILGSDFYFSFLYLVIIMIGKLIFFIFLPFNIYVLLDKKNARPLLSASLIALTSLSISIPLIRTYGLAGLALSQTIADILVPWIGFVIFKVYPHDNLEQ